MKSGLAFFCAVLLLTAVATPMSADEPSPAPTRFRASIGGFLGSSYEVVLRDGALACTKNPPGHADGKPKRVTPTLAQWREFRQTLDDLKVWQWRRNYVDFAVCDGTQWGLEIVYPDHILTVAGSNSYPDNSGQPSGQPEQTAAFKRYLAAVQKLTGGQPFD